MQKQNKRKIEAIFSLLIVIALFILVSYIANNNLEYFKELIRGYEILGIAAYIFLAILSVVLAPFAVLPIIPLISGIYGPFLTGLFTFFGWVIGDSIAFFIARKYGKPLVEKITSLEKIGEIENLMPRKRKFFGLVFLRIVLSPIDIFSYAVGLLTRIDWKLFISTTIIATLPMAFAFSYLGKFPLYLQAISLIAGVIFLIVFWNIISKKNNWYEKKCC